LEDLDTKQLIKGLIILTFNQNKQIKQLQKKTTGKFGGNGDTYHKDMKIKALEDEVKRLKITSAVKQTNIGKPKPTTSLNYSKVVKPMVKNVRSSSVTVESKTDKVKSRK
jgi:hypothetical protein